MHEHAELHFGTGAKGFVAVLNRKQGNPYYCWVDQLPELLASRPRKDLYFSLNTFATHNTASDKVWQFSAVYVGLDTLVAGVKPKDALQDLKRFYFGSETMPCPNYVVLSGNGVWAVWLIDPVTMGKRAQWQQVQDHFRSVLWLFNPDPNDPSKYIRVAGSTNSKSRSKVRLEVLQDRRYTLEELCKYLCEVPKPVQLPKKKRERQGDEKAPVITKSLKQLLWARVSDLKRLVALRKGRFLRQRNRLLTIFASTVYAASESWETALSETLNLNERLGHPLRVSQVKAIVRTCKRHGYWWQTQTMIDDLQVSAEEQRGMRTVIGPAEALARKRQRDEQRRRAKGVKDRLLSAEQTRREIIAIHASESVSNREIGRRLGISEGTVRNALKHVPHRCATKTPLFRSRTHGGRGGLSTHRIRMRSIAMTV